MRASRWRTRSNRRSERPSSSASGAGSGSTGPGRSGSRDFRGEPIAGVLRRLGRHVAFAHGALHQQPRGHLHQPRRQPHALGRVGERRAARQQLGILPARAVQIGRGLLDEVHALLEGAVEQLRAREPRDGFRLPRRRGLRAHCPPWSLPTSPANGWAPSIAEAMVATPVPASSSASLAQPAFPYANHAGRKTRRRRRAGGALALQLGAGADDFGLQHLDALLADRTRRTAPDPRGPARSAPSRASGDGSASSSAIG